MNIAAKLNKVGIPQARDRVVRRTTRGSVLVITVVFSGLIGVVLVAYLSMVSSQQKSSFRSQVWNSCIPMCEAGVEEALAHINYSGTTSNFAINGWVLSSSAYRKERSLNDGTVRMAISNVSPPVIYVTGLLRSPAQSNLLTRSVQVKTRINRRFPNAFLAKGTITMGGNNARVDSFNSTNILESTFGQYDPLKATDHAVVTTDSTAAGAVNVGNVSVYGKIATGPGGTVSINNNGNVGSSLWNNNPLNDGTIEAGHVVNDANVYIPNAVLPTDFAPSSPPANAMYNGTNYAYVIGAGDWSLSNVNLSSSGIIITGKARVYVSGTMGVSSTAFIQIANGASVEWYQGGNVNFSGQGLINDPGVAQNFSLIGLPGCTSISYSGQSKFVGTVYAPAASISLSGNADASGALVGTTINVSGGMNFHFDESLIGDPRKPRYYVSSWTEI